MNNNKKYKHFYHSSITYKIHAEKCPTQWTLGSCKFRRQEDI